MFKLINRHLALGINCGEQLLTFVHVDDLCDAILAALTKGPCPAEYFVTDTHSYTPVELRDCIISAIGKRPLKINIPSYVIRIFASLNELIGNFSGYYPALNNEKMAELCAKNWQCDVENTKLNLQFRPKYDLCTGIAQTVNWYKANNWL